MDDKKHYEELEDNFKSRQYNLLSLLESLNDEDDSEHLYPALQSLKTETERYSSFRFVAEGGEKRIDAAFDSIAQREVAFATPKNKNLSYQERFLKEARLMAFLEHPNIMPVYDIGLKDETPFFTMELIHGENLALKREKGPLSREKLDEFLVVFLRVCEAVAFAHSKGVVHLDIKPQNIQMGPFGEVLLCDWGLSKTVGSDIENDVPDELDKAMTADLTLNGVLRGTPGYMSPSLSQGKPGEFKDDIYALGATLYFILCGKCPHQSDDVKEILANTIVSDVEEPSVLFPTYNIPLSLEAVALKALAKENRYETVQEIRQEITSHLRGYATKAEEAGLGTILKLLYKRQKTLWNTVFVAILALLVITAVFIQSLHLEKEKESIARKAAELAQNEAEQSLKMYKNELRYNRYLMDGIDQSLKKIIGEVQKNNLPVDIQKILVKVGRGNLNGEAYEAAAQMLETLAENSSGEDKNDAIHDLIFTKIFMHDFNGALILLENLSEEEALRAEIFQFMPICEEFKDKPKPKGVLAIEDFRELVTRVSEHERSRFWFFTHAFNCYLRKCQTDEEVLDLYEVILDLMEPNRKYGLQLSMNYGKKVLFFTHPEQLKVVHMPQILDGLNIHSLDLRGTDLESLIFARELSVKEINISGTKIKNLRPLSYVEGIETVIVSSLEGIKWWRQLEQQGVQIKVLK